MPTVSWLSVTSKKGKNNTKVMVFNCVFYCVFNCVLVRDGSGCSALAQRIAAGF
jgi:hypothetical protein